MNASHHADTGGQGDWVSWRNCNLRVPPANHRYRHDPSGKIYEVVRVSNLITLTKCKRAGDDDKFPPTVCYRDTTLSEHDPLAYFSTDLVRWNTKFTWQGIRP